MTKLHSQLVLTVMSDLTLASVLPHQFLADPERSARAEVMLRLLAMLIWHRVIPYTPEEIADIAAADLQASVGKIGFPKEWIRDSQHHVRKVVLTSLQEAFKWYERDLRKEGVDPATLPRIPIPEGYKP